MSKSLGDFIQDRTESIDAEMITEYFIEKIKIRLQGCWIQNSILLKVAEV